ncbi:MAG: orotidine-5'-phosphate decarboxylase [Elusimicrobiota bacterium]|nr:orotidine-5'-phosphate decarboxylase [Elusimicrobiota bacterium]
MAELVFAVDIDKDTAQKLINKILPYVQYFKIGHRLFTESPEIIHFLNKEKKGVFLDLKYHDIPSVIGSAIRAVAEKYHPYAITVHISGGKKMLQQAVKSKFSLPEEIQPKIFGVTILTSLDNEDLKILGIELTITHQVKKMAHLAKQCLLDGIVCSGKEVKYIRKTFGRRFLTLVPGLKILDSKIYSDQKRAVKFDDVKQYVDYFVVGREIYESPDLLKAVKQIQRKSQAKND